MPEQSSKASARASMPTPAINERAATYFVATARAGGGVVAFVGLVGLLGYLYKPELLEQLGVAEPMSAACLLAAGLALLILAGDSRPRALFRFCGYLLGLFVSAVGGLALIAHPILRIPESLLERLGVDSLRTMPTSVSTSFLLGGLALALLDWRTRRGRVPSQHLSLLVVLIVALPLIANGYNIEPVHGISQFTSLAVHIALALAILGIGIFTCRPRSGVMAVICADDAGGMMARRLLIPAVLIPFLLGWAKTYAEKTVLVDEAFARPAFVLSLIVSFTALLWWNARAMSRLEAERAVALSEKQSALLRIASEQEVMSQERKQLIEELKRRAEELSTANAAKDRFLAVLSHELRTPLTPVLLSISMLEQSSAFPEELREDLTTIRRNVELESRLISDLLDLTRIARGKLQLQSTDVDLHQVVRAAVEICQRDASAHLIIDLAATRRFVRGDHTRLQQVFWNLIGNAQKFTPERGAIFIRTADAGGMIRVEVKDTGAGIDADVLSRLFHAFEQGAVRSERQQAGLGLGLAISKAVVEAHGGRINAYSEGRGRGAKFIVELPAHEKLLRLPAEPAGTASTPTGHLRRLSILLVEDHEPTLRAMSKLLEHMGHSVSSATTAAAALSAARQNGLDLLVCDLGLPDGSGLDVMRQLRRKFAGRAIALTGYGMESDIRASLDAGFAEHITKPVDSAMLEAALRRVADSDNH